ncbi:MAG TPA: sigma-70 family RNA polymerase sigma factor [Streptosporangiaceae bacterium]|nr:sigma-70 family RNA polymerase sigma factor [Streptosporangiaceae bacterium]
MTATTLARAQASDEDAFRELTEPYGRELQAHCYRILGSVHDAEDLMQETLLAAWRGLTKFEERSSVRAWLYKIATNRCLKVLRDTGRRPAVVAQARSGRQEPTRRPEPLWLEPLPDAMIDDLPDISPGPKARYEAGESLALAFVAGLQQLPPGQRAAAGAARRARLPVGRGRRDPEEQRCLGQQCLAAGKGNAGRHALP